MRHLVKAFAVLSCISVLGASAAYAGDIRIRIRDSEAGLLRSPEYDAEIVRTALEGEEFTAVTTYGDFYLVKDEETEAFLYVSFLVAEEYAALPENILVSGRMPIPQQEDLSYWQVTPQDQEDEEEVSFKMRSNTSGGMLTAHNGKKYPAKYDYNESYKPKVDGHKMVRDAKKFLGTPYVLGGTSLDGIDCSGLVQVCLGNQGIDVVHRSSLQAIEGRYVHYDELAPGDLIYFRDTKTSRYLSHVGIYVGGGKFIHAGQSIGEVAITKLSDKYFKSHYAFARRM